jgi:protein translocase SecG subunit
MIADNVSSLPGERTNGMDRAGVVHQQKTATMISIFLLVLGVLLTLVILAQSTTSGLATGFTNAYQVAGVKRTMHFLNRATWVLGGAFMLLCLVGR